MTLRITLPSHGEQTRRNLERWAALAVDPELAKWEGRIETDRHGHILVSPPPSANHGALQSKISHLLWTLMESGRVFSECPISTADGVKAADVAWASARALHELGGLMCFPRAPEICVEVLSPSNTMREMSEKRDLYFDAKAEEVWFCSDSGAMTFFIAGSSQPQSQSRLCSAFPQQVEL